MSVTVRRWWRCPLDVESLVVPSVEVAADEAARLAAERGKPVVVETTAELVRAAFGAFSHLRVDGRSVDPWAPMSGFLRTRDGFLRVHANYPHHAEAIRAATGASDRPTLDDAASSWRADDLEAAIIEAGGIATRVRTEREWREHPHGLATAEDPWIHVQRAGSRPVSPSRGRPLDGIRVLDLTRVLAGPSCSQMLACLGADVLRVDPPRIPELIDQHLVTGMGKRSAVADLAERGDEVRGLARSADVVLLGYRPGSLDRYGLSPEELVSETPSLVVGSLSAWGESGPWGERGGFDSIVQAATGIAEVCAREDGAPGALPVQALDYATGAHLAARVMGLLADGVGGIVRASLVGAARTLLARDRIAHDEEIPLGVPVVNVSSPHGELLAVPPPLLVDRRTIERDVGEYGGAALEWAS
ncbi:CoA transferase [Microbacterium karelineae]|uniref:CoA transferase n=1 Tax=Microbacterium karelineae TaxID=2654283 RepID=UPI0012EA9D5B|nr:CoA transferase [Microbacterium karelineae]